MAKKSCATGQNAVFPLKIVHCVVTKMAFIVNRLRFRMIEVIYDYVIVQSFVNRNSPPFSGFSRKEAVKPASDYHH